MTTISTRTWMWTSWWRGEACPHSKPCVRRFSSHTRMIIVCIQHGSLGLMTEGGHRALISPLERDGFSCFSSPQLPAKGRHPQPAIRARPAVDIRARRSIPLSGAGHSTRSVSWRVFLARQPGARPRFLQVPQALRRLASSGMLTVRAAFIKPCPSDNRHQRPRPGPLSHRLPGPSQAFRQQRQPCRSNTGSSSSQCGRDKARVPLPSLRSRFRVGRLPPPPQAGPECPTGPAPPRRRCSSKQGVRLLGRRSSNF